MRIMWNTEVNAPGCPGEIVAEDGQTVLIQTDYDYPPVAESFGWSLRNVQRCPDCGQIVTTDAETCESCGEGFAPCDHSGTDGTIDCPDCPCTASDFISAAGEWLRDNDGATADDPGYFAEA